MRFTVAITVWRREHLLPHAILSVLRQSCGDWEIRVYSDGFSRYAHETVAALADRVPITYCAARRRRGRWGNHLRRLALEEAHGEHVVVLGHDCLLYESYLEAHAHNLGGDPDALSVVPVDYWRDRRFDRVLPDPLGPMRLAAGQIDLLCIAYPRCLTLELDCFGSSDLRRRDADFLAFDRLRHLSAPRLLSGETRAAHF